MFGEGSRDARVILVGEQPGDREDIVGAPFVGPAGGILDEALEAAGIDRKTVFLTNVVKHFKWKPRAARHARCVGPSRGSSAPLTARQGFQAAAVAAASP